MNYTKYFIDANKFNKDEMFIRDNLVLETIMGSHAYGCNTETSDFDILGVFMDRPIDIYPQNHGLILGFDQIPKFERKEIKGADKRIILPNGRECEAEWHSLTHFFYLTGLKGSIPLIECLFTKRNFVAQGSDIGWTLRDNRKLFLSARTFHSFKGYAAGQLHRIRNGYTTKKSDNSTRQIYLDKFGYDVKMAYHLLRLLDEIEQIVVLNDIDLQRSRETCIQMRNGEWGSFDRLEKYFNTKIEDVESLLLKSKLPMQPRVEELHQLLANCIEQYYGSMDKIKGTEYISAKDIKEQLDRIEQVVTRR